MPTLVYGFRGSSSLFPITSTFGAKRQDNSSHLLGQCQNIQLPDPIPPLSSLGNQTIPPSETHSVSSPRTQRQLRVPVERSRKVTSSSSWWWRNTRSSDRSHSSDWPTPVKRPPSRHWQPPSTRRSSSGRTRKTVTSKMSVGIWTPPSVTNSWRCSRTHTSPPSIMRSWDTTPYQR